MKRIEIGNVKDIATMMFNAVTLAGNTDASFVGLYEDVSRVFKELCKFDELDIEYVELEVPDIGGYEREYALSITNAMTIFCEKIFDEQHRTYLSDYSDVLFIADDCNSKLLEDFKGELAYEIGLLEKPVENLCYYCCCNDCRLCEFD